MITLRRLIDNKHLSTREIESLDSVCSLLCFRLPVDIHYGNSSLVTCVDVIPRDLLGYKYPDYMPVPLDDGSEHVFVFKSIISNGTGPIVLGPDIINSIRVITQSRRTRGCVPCRSCGRYDNCILKG